MSQLPPIITTFVGRLTADPELRFTASGAPVANFTIVANEREWDQATREYKDGPPTFIRCSLWRQYAENVAESLHKGDHVMALGKLRQRSWETRDGEKRTSIELDVQELGPALRWATATVRRNQPKGQGGGQQWGGYNNGGNGGHRDNVGDDPWGSAPSGGDFGGSESEPPF